MQRIWRIWGPYLVALVYLALGYLHYAPGTAYRLSAAAYRAWSFPAFQYSDIIWLYLRDGLQGRPIPYVDYPLEYPPLTGLISYALSYAPDLPSYFRLAYLLLAASALLTIWVLKRIPEPIRGCSLWRRRSSSTRAINGTWPPSASPPSAYCSPCAGANAGGWSPSRPACR